MTKRYRSFEEINARLKVLKLLREIDTENLKLHVNRAKTNFYPPQLLGGVSNTIQQVMLTFAIKKLSRIFHRSRPKEISE